jgi:FAD:protein FMN transferase
MIDQPHALTIEKKSASLWRGFFSAMASPCEILLESETADDSQIKNWLTLGANEVWRIEKKWSRYNPHNIISQINSANGAAVTVDAETAQILNYAAQCYQLSQGKFDITSGPLRRIWQFKGAEFTPDNNALTEILKIVGWQNCQWNPPILQIPQNAEIDLGGIGKEYAADRALGLIMAAQSAHDLHVLVNLGGDLVCSGPRLTNLPWQVGIENLTNIPQPENPNNPVISLYQGGIATSGDTYRYCLHQGKRLSHILDPQTGWPVANAPQTITVMANTCTLAGMLATFAMLQGEYAEDFLQAQNAVYWVQRVPEK